MELLVGENSYVSLEEAENIVKKLYISSDKEREYWDKLSDEDKTVLIYRANMKLNNPSMLWLGHKYNRKQKMEFPRVTTYRYIEFDNRLKEGLIRLAIEGWIAEHSEEQQMISKGITSFSDGGGMSVHFDNSNIVNVLGIPPHIFAEYFIHLTLICK